MFRVNQQKVRLPRSAMRTGQPLTNNPAASAAFEFLAARKKPQSLKNKIGKNLALGQVQVGFSAVPVRSYPLGRTRGSPTLGLQQPLESLSPGNVFLPLPQCTAMHGQRCPFFILAF